MKVLFIGGTGNISTSVSRLAVEKGIDLVLLNRGQHRVEIPGVQHIIGDINQPEKVRETLRGWQFDAVVNWLAQLQAGNGLSLESASFERLTTVGTVNASIVLRQPN